MQIEYEATFTNINKNAMRKRLVDTGASLVRREFMQKRKIFSLPKGSEVAGGWARVRDEGDKITMSIKVHEGEGIESQKETCVEVGNFEEGELMLKNLGCEERAYQESKRELWDLDGVEVTIDEWPFLEPFVEIEGENEAMVKQVAEKLSFDWSSAKFCSVGDLYTEKYTLKEGFTHSGITRLVFDMENPFTFQGI